MLRNIGTQSLNEGSVSYIPANTSELDVVVVICGVGSAETWLPITRRVNPTLSTGILLTP